MRIITGFDEEKLKEIARASGNRQLIRDVAYLRTIIYHNSKKLYCERLEDIAFFAGYNNKDHFRLVGIGVRKDAQGKGYGRFLFKRAVEHAKGLGYGLIKTRTQSGVDFYQKWGGAKITGMVDDDYLMEIKI